jgi:two-component system cell cycle sensor histidine kinase/response regulator CckA
MPAPFPLPVLAISNPVALMAVWPAALGEQPGALEWLAWLPFLVVAAFLWWYGGRQRGSPARLFGLLALLAVSGVAARALVGLSAQAPGGAWGWAAIVAVAVAWGAAVGLVRAMPRALARWEWAARGDELDRLRLLEAGEAAVAASGDGVMIAEACPDVQSGLRIVFANPAFEERTGYAPSEAVGLSPSVFAADELDREWLEEETAREGVRAALRATSPTRLEVPSRHKDGSRVWAEWHVVPVADAAGRITHWIAILRDTTARRRSEEALRQTAELLKAVADGTTDAVFVKDRQGRYLLFNPAASQFVGRPAEEVIGKDDTAVFDPDSARRLMEQDRRIMESGRGEMVEQRLTAAGITRTYQSTKAPYRDGQGKVIGLVGISRDITDYRQAEQALREREDLLRSVIAHIPCGVFWKDRRSVFLGCNDRVARDHGLRAAEQVVGRTDDELGVKGPEAAFFRDCDRRVIDTGEPMVDVEGTRIRPDGTKAVYLTSKVPLRDASGAVVGVLGLYQDVTDRRRLEEQYRQSQKMEAVGRLAGGIAHDFNNLLTVIVGNADLLRESPPHDPARADRVNDIRGAADRAAALVRQLLTFGRRQTARPEVVELSEAVAATAAMLGRVLGEPIAVKTEPAGRPVPVRIDRGQLEQVVMNLAVNAKDAMPHGGVLTLRTEVLETTATHPEVPPSRFAQLVVSDTGVGMTDEVKARIFEPFFTTKGPDRGTGLGLATVYGIVEQAGGRIEVESAPGAGTTFRIDFPWCESPAPGAEIIPPAAGPPGGCGCSVLLVEDEEGVRGFARQALESHGYAVVDAADGEAAVELLDPARPLDLLITDVVMPGMDGRELALRVRASWPGAGVVFVSGYVPDPGRLDEVPDAVFLPKPFTPGDLVRAACLALARTNSAQMIDAPPTAGYHPGL